MLQVVHASLGPNPFELLHVLHSHFPNFNWFTFTQLQNVYMLFLCTSGTSFWVHLHTLCNEKCLLWKLHKCHLKSVGGATLNPGSLLSRKFPKWLVSVTFCVVEPPTPTPHLVSLSSAWGGWKCDTSCISGSREKWCREWCYTLLRR